MYYIKNENDYLVKYKVSLNIEELKNLRINIIDNCSIITHKRYTTTNRPNQYDTTHIRNYHEQFIKSVSYHDFYIPDEDEYLVEYDHYEHHELVSLIERLLDCDMSVIKKIEELKDVENKDTKTIIYEDIKNNLEKFILSADCSSELLRETKHNLDRLSNLQNEIELNKNQLPITNYIDQVLSCIILEEIDIINVKEVLKVVNFLENTPLSFNYDTKLLLEKKK